MGVKIMEEINKWRKWITIDEAFEIGRRKDKYVGHPKENTTNVVHIHCIQRRKSLMVDFNGVGRETTRMVNEKGDAKMK